MTAALARRLPPVSGYPMAARGSGLSPLGDCALEAARINDADAGMCRHLLAWVFWLEGQLQQAWEYTWEYVIDPCPSKGYRDMGITVGLGSPILYAATKGKIGNVLSVGLQCREGQGWHWYVSGGGGTPGVSANYYYAPGQDIVTGGFCGVAVSAIIKSVGVGGQAGGSDVQGEDPGEFGEVGASVRGPGYNVQCGVVSEVP